MNKKLIQTIICIGAVLCSATLSQAATVVHLNESEGTVRTVSGGYNAGEIGSIMVLKPGVEISSVDEASIKDKVYYMQTATADENGVLNFNFKLDDNMATGSYKIRIFGAESDEDDLSSGEFFYVTQTEMNSLLYDYNKEVNFVDCVNKLIKYISLPQEYLGDGTVQTPNTKYLSKIIETALRNKRAVGKYADYQTLKEEFYHTVAETIMVSKPSDYQKALSCLKLSEITLPENAEENFAEICKNISEYSISSDEQFQNALKQATAVAELNKLDRSKLDAGLSKYKDLLGISSNSSYIRYTQLGEDGKIQVCAKIAQSGFTSPKSITDALESALPKIIINTGGGSNSSSSGNTSGKGNINLNLTTNTNSQGGTIQSSVPKCNFRDLNGFEWAQTAVKMLCEKEIISGRNEESFAPGESVTRAEFLKMAMEAFGLTSENAKCTMSDVNEGDWFYKYAAAAEEKGIILGDGGAFRPNDKITRQDIAVMLDRIIEAAGLRPEQKYEEKSFGDEADTSDYARESVTAMCRYGFIEGDDNNSFRAKDNATRAEAAVLIYRVYMAK